MDKSYSAFYDAYRELCKQGKCDAADGQEMKRVQYEWENGGIQEAVRQFIIRRANADAEGDEPKGKSHEKIKHGK